MRVDPSVSVKNLSKIEVNFYLPNIIEVPGKNISSSSSGNCFIRTNYSSQKTYSGTISENNYIIIRSKYLSAWNESFNRLLGEEIKNGYASVAITQHEGTDVVKITSISKSIDLELIVVDIYAQIGPGWVI